MAFKKASKKQGKLRMAISGVSGGGKTYSSILFAKEFGQRVAVIDSEHGSASLYADLADFDVQELTNHSIQAYLSAMSEAAQAGYDVLVLDSLSHSWMDVLAKVDQGGGWGKAGKAFSPLNDKLVTAILTYPGHVIATLRSKTAYEVEGDGRSIKGMRKVGLAPVARPDAEFDFGVWLEVHREGLITVSKTRCSALEGQTYDRGGDIPRIAGTLKAWISDGVPTAGAKPSGVIAFGRFKGVPLYQAPDFPPEKLDQLREDVMTAEAKLSTEPDAKWAPVIRANLEALAPYLKPQEEA